MADSVDEAIQESVTEAVEEATDDMPEEVAEEVAEEVEAPTEETHVSVAGEVNESLEMGDRYRSIAREESLRVITELAALEGAHSQQPTVVVVEKPAEEPMAEPEHSDEESYEEDEEPRRESFYYKKWGRNRD
jgi:hypothetical protein